MNDTTTIPANDHGQIRIFAIDGDPADNLTDKTPDALFATFGAAPINPDFVDVVTPDDLGEMTLIAYLRKGYDIEPGAMDLAQLSTVTGAFIVVMSRAFNDAETTLHLHPSVRLVTTCADPVAIMPMTKIITPSASGIIPDAPAAKPPKSDARIGGMVAMVALLFMFALVGLMIWIAG